MWLERRTNYTRSTGVMSMVRLQTPVKLRFGVAARTMTMALMRLKLEAEVLLLLYASHCVVLRLMSDLGFREMRRWGTCSVWATDTPAT